MSSKPSPPAERNAPAASLTEFVAQLDAVNETFTFPQIVRLDAALTALEKSVKALTDAKAAPPKDGSTKPPKVGPYVD